MRKGGQYETFEKTNFYADQDDDDNDDYNQQYSPGRGGPSPGKKKKKKKKRTKMRASQDMGDPVGTQSDQDSHDAERARFE